MIGVSLLGNGVVGSGVCSIILSEPQLLEKKCGQSVALCHVFVRRDYENCTYTEHFTRNIDTIINDSQTNIVVEAMGGLEPAYTYVRRALEAGKCVVTANKHLIAEKGCELLQIAAQHSVKLLFEASVGGTIPIIRPLHRCLAANEIQEIQGILNGTSNFILTQMKRKNMEFDTAVSLAQELGYAEVDPSADVNGTDTCRKICILSSIAFGKNVNPAQVYMEGIEGITASDMSYAESRDYSIKLVARAINGFDGSAQILVAPHLIPFSNPLHSVDDVFNAVQIIGGFSGPVMMYGQGAGSYPTASAVVADIIDCAAGTEPQSTLSWSPEPLKVEPIDYMCIPFYVRVAGKHELDTVLNLGGNEQETAFITTPISHINLKRWLFDNNMQALSLFPVIE